MTNATYEFTPEQNVTLARLAARMRVVGRALILVALLATAESLLLTWKGSGSAVGYEMGAVLLLIGFWSARAGREFLQVTETRGADIPHLMSALRELRKLYDLQFWALVILAALIALALLAALAGPGRIAGPYP